MSSGINFLAVVVCTFLNAGIWFLWYRRKSAQQTLSELGARADEDGRYRLPWSILGLASFLYCYALAAVLAAGSIDTWAEGLLFGLLIGFGIVGLAMVPAFVIERRPRKVFSLHGGAVIWSTVIVSLVLASWRG